MKYPLSQAAKDAAREMVQKWNARQLEQWMEITPRSSEGSTNVTFAGLSQQRILQQAGYPLAGILMELAKYGLIEVRFVYDAEGKTKNIQILLLEELRNAVKNDFEVSPYFLTLNAVGNIIVNSTTGPVQGVGYNQGVVHQNVEELADWLSAQLGEEFLASQEALRGAIEELRVSTEKDRPSKLGRLIMQLGHSLEHGANTIAIVSALPAITAFLTRALGM